MKTARTALGVFALILLGAWFVSLHSFVTTSFYLAPNVSTGTHAGTQTNPWQTLNWGSINAALATGNVTVYFTASNAAHNANQTSTTQVSIQRTDTSANVLTFDGISFYNNSDSSPPASWPANYTVTPCVYGTSGCGTDTAFKFQITNAASPITSNNDTGSTCRTGVTLTGFKTVQTAGPSSQAFDWVYMENTVVQYMDISAASTTSGPGAYLGPGNHGPGTGCGHTGVPNVTLQYSWVHQTYGECVYVGASSSDPVTPPFSTVTGDNYLLQYNRLEDCARWGGQGEGFDIKDGHTNLRVVGNIVRPNLSGLAPAPDGQGIEFESASLIDSNYVEQPFHNGVTVASAWCNSVGRGTVLVTNNIIVNINGGGHQFGSELFDTLCDNTHNWQSVQWYNNSIFNTANACINIAKSGNKAGVGIAENNIGQSCAGGGITSNGSGSGSYTTIDYNDLFNSGSCPGTGGAHTVCGNPNFLTTSTPYTATNFKLAAGSAAIDTGLDLSGTFTLDYFGVTRTVPWEIGAAVFAGGSPTVSLSPTTLAFGSVTVGVTSSPLSTTLTNTGSSTLTISSITLGGTNPTQYAISSNGCGGTLAASANCIVQVTFTPGSAASLPATLIFATNAASTPDNVSLTGTGVATAPTVSLSPTSLAFGNQTVNTTSDPKTILLTNTGTATLTIASIAGGGANPTQYHESDNCGASLPAGEHCTITITFNPTSAGSKPATVAVTSNATSSPDSATLSGTGVTPGPTATCPGCFAKNVIHLNGRGMRRHAS